MISSRSPVSRSVSRLTPHVNIVRSDAMGRALLGRHDGRSIFMTTTPPAKFAAAPPRAEWPRRRVARENVARHGIPGSGDVGDLVGSVDRDVDGGIAVAEEPSCPVTRRVTSSIGQPVS